MTDKQRGFVGMIVYLLGMIVGFYLIKSPLQMIGSASLFFVSYSFFGLILGCDK